MKILNLFSGIGGNRTNWNDHWVEAVDYDLEISLIYQKRFPNDQVHTLDVYEFIRIPNLDRYDFIWASPPCQTHSCATSFHRRSVPDMTGIHGLHTFFKYQIKNKKTKWVIENVQPWYKLPQEWQPTNKIDRHLFWANFHIPPMRDDKIPMNPLPQYKHLHKRQRSLYMRGNIHNLAEYHQFDLSLLEGYPDRKDTLLKNMTHFTIADHILTAAQDLYTLDDFFPLD